MIGREGPTRNHHIQDRRKISGANRPNRTTRCVRLSVTTGAEGRGNIRQRIQEDLLLGVKEPAGQDMVRTRSGLLSQVSHVPHHVLRHVRVTRITHGHQDLS